MARIMIYPAGCCSHSPRICILWRREDWSNESDRHQHEHSGSCVVFNCQVQAESFRIHSSEIQGDAIALVSLHCIAVLLI